MGTKWVGAQVPMSKLTWLSKDMLAQSPAKEMGGEFVLAGRGSIQIPFTDLCSDASLQNISSRPN